MKTYKKALPKNKQNNNKPTEEALPTSEQQPMGDDDDIKEDGADTTERDKKDTNNVSLPKH